MLAVVIFAALGWGKRSFEAYCPFGGMESLWGLLQQGEFSCALGPLNLSMLIAVLLLALLAKKAFCGWACPIGFLGEILNRLGGSVYPTRPLPGKKLNGGLKLLRYPVLLLALFFTYNTGELILRGYDPFYAIFSGFTGHGTLGWITITVTIGIVLGGLIVPMFFCRYLCPLGAVFDPFSRLGLLKIVRRKDSCTACGECALSCPQGLAPNQMLKIRHRDCTNCLECLDACPEDNTLELRLTL